MREPRMKELDKLKEILKREKMTLGDVRRLLLPTDPWEAARGLWKDRKIDAVREQRRLRKEWDRT